MPIKTNREYRNIDPLIAMPQTDANTELRAAGYAATYDRYLLYVSERYGEIYEKFERTSFDGCDMSDVIMQYDHTGHVLARTSNGTLILRADDKGLFFDVDLSKSDAAKSLYGEIQSKLVTKMSWAFTDNEMVFDKPTNTIIHKSVKKIYDISAVSYPANENTEIFARGLSDGAIGQIEAECRKRDIIKIMIKTKIGGII